jgi:alpha-beta hydrolase superfamily lysophospholipase
VKCLVVQLAFGDGERVILGDKSAEEKERILATIQKVWTKTVKQNKGMAIGVNRFLTDTQSQAFYKDYVEAFPQLKVKIPFLTMKEIIEHKPERLLHAMDTPILIVGAENDDVNPKEESSILFEKAKGPKQLEMIKGATHYAIYEGEKCEQTAALELEWCNKFLN